MVCKMFRRYSRALLSHIADTTETVCTRLAMNVCLLRSLQEFDIATAVSTARSLYVVRPQREHDLQLIGMRAIAFCHCPLRVLALPGGRGNSDTFFRHRYNFIPLHVSRTDTTVPTN
jgi:hypothetical protein